MRKVISIFLAFSVLLTFVTSGDIIEVIKSIEVKLDLVGSQIHNLTQELPRIIKEEIRKDHEKRGSLHLFQSQVSIKKSNQVATLPVLTKEYEVSFEVYPTKFENHWSSVLHLTTHGNCDYYGDRIPGIWSSKDTILASNAISGELNWCFYSQGVPPLNQWAKMRLTQTLERSTYIYRIYLNGKQILQKNNTQPKDFHNVKVYVGDPWYPPQPGYIKNLNIKYNSAA